MSKVVHPQLRHVRDLAQAMEHAIDVAGFDVAAMRGCEDQAGVAPLRAGCESFLELSLTVAAQDGHQRNRDRQHGDRGLRLHLVQRELAVDPMQRLSDGQSSVLEVDIGPGQPQRFAPPESHRQRHRPQRVEPVLLGRLKAQTAATNQIHALLVIAPAELRERYRRHNSTALVKALARCRPAAHRDATTVAVLTAAKALAQRTEFLERQKADLTTQLDVLVGQINPALRAAYGVGPDTAAQLLVTAGANPHRLRNEASFAALCGAAPVPASSGKITRHRLSRGGDRAANNALYRIALVRMSSHPQTRDYVERQATKGRTKKEILRLLKRAIAREVFRLLTRAGPVDDYSDLRPARQAKNLTLATVAHHFGVPIITVSRLERGHQRNDTLANNYRQWLTAA